MAGSTYGQMAPEFGVSELVCTLSVSLFVAGLGTGPCEYKEQRLAAIWKFPS